MLSSFWQYLNQHTPLFYLTQPIWRDEAFSILIAQKNPLQIIQTASADFTPPLFYLILHYWMLLFGTGEMATRLLSLVFHVGTAIVVYPLTKLLCREFKLKNQSLPLYAFLLTLLNPMLLYYGFEVRAYSLLALFVTLSFYALIARRRYLYIISASLGLYAHYYFALAYLSQIIYLVFTSSSIKNLRKKIYIVTPILIFSPWIPYLINQIISSTESWYYPVTLRTWITSFGRLFTNYRGSRNGLEVLLTLFTACIAGFGLFIAHHKNKIGKLLLLWLFLPTLIVLVISGFKPIWVNRYLIYVAVAEVMIITIMIDYLPRKRHFTVFAIILAINFLINQVSIQHQRKFDYRTPLNSLKTQLKPGDLVAVTDSLVLFEARYYLSKQQNSIKLLLPPNTQLPSYVGTAIINKEDIIYTLPTDKTVYLLNLDGSIISAEDYEYPQPHN